MGRVESTGCISVGHGEDLPVERIPRQSDVAAGGPRITYQSASSQFFSQPVRSVQLRVARNRWPRRKGRVPNAYRFIRHFPHQNDSRDAELQSCTLSGPVGTLLVPPFDLNEYRLAQGLRAAGDDLHGIFR